MRKLRSIAFQRCITLYSQKWTVWPWEAIFYQKMLHKQLLREALNPDSLTSEQSGTPNFKNLTSFNMFPENLGAKAFRWAIGKPAGIKIVRLAAAWNISWGGPQEMQKSEFFASFASPRKFCEEKFYQDRTMWKSTDSAFRICMTLGGPDDLSHSYCSSKSGDGGKSEFVHEIMIRWKKKDTATIFKILAPNRISVELYGLVPRWFDLEHKFWKLWPCLFFVTPLRCLKKNWNLTRLWQQITLV